MDLLIVAYRMDMMEKSLTLPHTHAMALWKYGKVLVAFGTLPHYHNGLSRSLWKYGKVLVTFWDFTTLPQDNRERFKKLTSPEGLAFIAWGHRSRYIAVWGVFFLFLFLFYTFEQEQEGNILPCKKTIYCFYTPSLSLSVDSVCKPF